MNAIPPPTQPPPFNDKLYRALSPIQDLLTQRQKIEADFGEGLDWQELPGKKACRITIIRNDVDPSDEQQYPELHSWMLDKMNRFKKAFAAPVLALPRGEETEGDDA